MGARGPKPGAPNAGRPRLATHKPDGNGYVRSTQGPPGKGTLQYEHRVKAEGKRPGGRALASAPGKTTTKVVDHKNGSRASNGRGNLRVVSRSVNAKNKH